MTDTEKFEQVVKYLIRRYKEESNIYAELGKKGDMINAAKASVRLEIFWEIILFINKLDINEMKNQCKKPTDNCNYQSAGGKMSDISTFIITQEVNNDRT